MSVKVGFSLHPKQYSGGLKWLINGPVNRICLFYKTGAKGATAPINLPFTNFCLSGSSFYWEDMF